MCGAKGTPAASICASMLAQARDAAVGRHVDAGDVDGVVREDRLGVVRAALLVSHRDGQSGAAADLRDHARVARRNDVLHPAEADILDRAGELDRVRGVLEHPVAVHPEPAVGPHRRCVPRASRARVSSGVAAIGCLKRRQPASLATPRPEPATSAGVSVGG